MRLSVDNINEKSPYWVISLDEKSVSFTTGGEQGIENINTSSNIYKVALDGQILILRGDKTYTLTGQEIK